MRVLHATAAAIAALAIACGGAARQKSAAPRAGDPHTNAAPADPRQHIEQLMAEVRRQGHALDIPVAKPRPAPAGGPDRPTPGGTPPRPVPRASTCTDVCRLKDSICQNSERICALANERLPNDEWARRQCDAAEDACIRAKERCSGCGK